MISPATSDQQPATTMITVIIPAHNEADTIARVIKELLRLPLRLQIILVNDGSTDDTLSVAMKAFTQGNRTRHAAPSTKHYMKLEVVTSSIRKGKGAAIRRALSKARGEIVAIQDADHEYSPTDLPRLVAPILEGEADVVYGSRFKGKMKGMALPNLMANRLLAMTASLLYLTPVSDEATCYKAFDRKWLSKIKLRADGFDFCPEVTARLLKRGARYREVPVSYVARTKREGKKVRYSDGIIALWTLVKYRFSG